MNPRPFIRPHKPVCADPEWCPRCSMAAHCHDRRVGKPGPYILWPAVALALFVVCGTLVAVL